MPLVVTHVTQNQVSYMRAQQPIALIPVES